jgi:hypothetical protein
MRHLLIGWIEPRLYSNRKKSTVGNNLKILEGCTA